MWSIVERLPLSLTDHVCDDYLRIPLDISPPPYPHVAASQFYEMEMCGHKNCLSNHPTGGPDGVYQQLTTLSSYFYSNRFNG